VKIREGSEGVPWAKKDSNPAGKGDKAPSSILKKTPSNPKEMQLGESHGET